MIILTLCAILAACVLAFIATPAMNTGTKTGRIFGAGILCVGALATVAIYLSLGAPDTPPRAAAFEPAEHPRAQMRLMQQEELILLQTLSGDANNTGLLLRLGVLQIESGRPRDAIIHLTRAHELTPKNTDVKIALAAAHFTHGLMIAAEDKPGATLAGRKEIERAIPLTPKNHPLYADIQRALAAQNQ